MNKFDNSKYKNKLGQPLFVEEGGFSAHKSARYKNFSAENSDGSKPLPNLYDDLSQCCGCSACFAVCPAEAIAMEDDEEGFFYPVVDAEKCVRCYRCEKVCAFKR